MGAAGGFGDPLVQEVLADVAETFFGARKALDDFNDIFLDFVERLREKGDRVTARAGLLNYLLIDAATAADFYRRIGVAPSPDLLESRRPPQGRRRSIPVALTARGRFRKLVRRTYADLHQAIRDYNHGSRTQISDPEEVPVYYNLIRSMCEVINEKVRRINDGMSPASVLQYAKKFDIEATAKARVTGSTASAYNGVDAKFECRPIDFDRLDLAAYPDLPDPAEAASCIRFVCRRLYAASRPEVRRRLRRLSG